MLLANEAGRFFRSDALFVDRLTSGALSDDDRHFLVAHGFATEHGGDLAETCFLNRLGAGLQRPGQLRHVILVPTLRCDLACDYCQVSRANVNARGHDWTDALLAQTLAFLDVACTDDVQIEFQGGEPTLRLDLLEAVTTHCRKRFRAPRFVLCTNLSRLDDRLEAFIGASDVLVSTSLDGEATAHQRQRTRTAPGTEKFFANLRRAVALCPGRIDALPTLDPERLPDPGVLLDAFDRFGMRTIFLRPVAFHGFARKSASRGFDERWARFYEAVITEMIKRNADLAEGAAPYGEFTLTLAFRRLLQVGVNSYADLRSPNWLGHEHAVVDYDGVIYPTDEARMLARSRVIDLAIGHVADGIDPKRRRAMQGAAFNALDPWCSQCPYQAACGSDPVDDIARSGRTDSPRPLTAFCQRQMHIFDLAIALLYNSDRNVQASLARWLDLPSPVQLGLSHP